MSGGADAAARWTALDLFWEELVLEGGGECNANAGTEAERAFRAAFRMLDGTSADDPRRAATLSNIAAARRLQAELADAERLYREALAIWRQAPQWTARMTVRLSARSSSFHMRLEARHRDNFTTLRRHQNARLATGGEAATLNNLAELLAASGRAGEAKPLYEQALEKRADAVSWRDPDVARICDNLFACAESLGAHPEAGELGARAMKIRADPIPSTTEKFRREAGDKMTDERRLKGAAYLALLLDASR